MTTEPPAVCGTRFPRVGAVRLRVRAQFRVDRGAGRQHASPGLAESAPTRLDALVGRVGARCRTCVRRRSVCGPGS